MTLGTVVTHPSQFAATLAGFLTVALLAVTIGGTNWRLTQNTRPAGQALALQRLCANSMFAAGQHLAIATQGPRPTQSATTLSGIFAIATCRVTVLAANGWKFEKKI